MENKETKRRVALSYIVLAVAIIAILISSQVIRNMINSRNAADNPDSLTDAADDPDNTALGDTEPDDTEEIADEAEEEPADLGAEYCTVDNLQYRIESDADILAEYGLPEKITEDIIGGSFATAGNNITLYAYPALGCRAYLIAGKDEAYSFSILDGFADSSLVTSMETVLSYYSIFSAADIASVEIGQADAVRTLRAEEIDTLYNALSDTENAGKKASLSPDTNLRVVTAKGAVLEFSYHSDLSLISCLGAYFNVSEDFTRLISKG